MIEDQVAPPELPLGQNSAEELEKSADGSAQKEEDRGKRRRCRSSRPYPPASLEDATSFVRDIYNFNSGLPARKLSFFDHIGRSPDSSLSRDAITNANKYGLLKSSFASDTLELTDDALSIVAEHSNLQAQARAKVRLGVENIAPFNTIYQRIAGNRLPQKSALIDALKEAGIPQDAVDEAVDLLIVNLRFVGLLQVLAGAERVMTLEFLLANVPEVDGGGTQQRDLPPSSEIPTQSVQKISNLFRTSADSSADLDKICFYITPIGAVGSEARKHSDLFLSSIVEPAISPLGLEAVRADMIGQPGIITRQIDEYILRAKLVIADLSFHNPNVFYELALRHAIRLPIVQLVQKSDNIPFDINQMRTIETDNTNLYSFVPNMEAYKSEIATQARRALDAGLESETPISIYFPNLKIQLN